MNWYDKDRPVAYGPIAPVPIIVLPRASQPHPMFDAVGQGEFNPTVVDQATS